MTSNTNTKRSVKAFIVLILIFGTIGIILHGRWLGTLPQIYTVGKVIDIFAPAKGGLMAKYGYHYHGKKHDQIIPLGDYREKVKKGERYLVEIPEGYPDEGLMLFDHSIPDSIEAPLEGWAELPDFAR